MTKIYVFLLIATIFVSFSSCQVKVGEVTANSEAVSMDGTWQTGCMPDSSDSSMQSFIVSNGSMSMAKLTFVGTRTCDPTKLSTTEMASGSINIVGTNINNNLARNFEWTLSVVSLFPNAASVVDSLNNNNVCNSNAWVLNQATFIFGCNVAVGIDLTQVTPGTKHYGFFVVQPNITPPILQFSDDCAVAGYQGFCPTVEDRPTSLSGTVFTKK